MTLAKDEGMERTWRSILPAFYGGGQSRRRSTLVTLWFQAALFGAASLAICTALKIEQAGFISIFLLAASLSDRLDRLLRENRTAILDLGVPSWKANGWTASCVLAMFAGVVTAYAAAAALVGPEGGVRSFGFALDAANLNEGTLFTRRFSSLGELLRHNYLVLFCILLLAFIYRSFGALLALTWNGCIWGFVLTVLAVRGFEAAGVSALGFVAISSCALLPHLALEGLAYILAALAGIYLSKALFKYPFGDPVLKASAGSSLNHLLLALAVLLAAALAESFWAPLMLGLLSP